MVGTFFLSSCGVASRRELLESPAAMPLPKRVAASRLATRPVHAGAPPPLPEHLRPFAAIANSLMAAVFWGDGRSKLAFSLFCTPPLRKCILLLKSRQRSLNSHVQAVPDSPPLTLVPIPLIFNLYM